MNATSERRDTKLPLFRRSTRSTQSTFCGRVYFAKSSSMSWPPLLATSLSVCVSASGSFTAALHRRRRRRWRRWWRRRRRRPAWSDVVRHQCKLRRVLTASRSRNSTSIITCRWSRFTSAEVFLSQLTAPSRDVTGTAAAALLSDHLGM